MADMKKVYDDLIIINLYLSNLCKYKIVLIFLAPRSEAGGMTFVFLFSLLSGSPVVNIKQ